ncbi:MAG: hypothetical protein ACLUSL_06700 [Ruminococcus sp.]
MSDFALKLDTPNVIHVYQNRIASFSLKQEIYTPTPSSLSWDMPPSRWTR